MYYMVFQKVHQLRRIQKVQYTQIYYRILKWIQNSDYRHPNCSVPSAFYMAAALSQAVFKNPIYQKSIWFIFCCIFFLSAFLLKKYLKLFIKNLLSI